MACAARVGSPRPCVAGAAAWRERVRPRARHCRPRALAAGGGAAGAAHALVAASAAQAQQGAGGLGADAAAALALLLSAGAVLATAGAVGGRLGTAVGQRNLELRVAARLREAEQALLAGEGNAVELREEVARAKALLASLAQEAEEGRGIRGRTTAPPLTPVGFLGKSFASLLKDRAERGGDQASAATSAVAAAVLVALCYYLLALMS